MPKSRKRKQNKTYKKHKLKQKGGLLGHVTGFHLSERGIRHILMGNHRVKKRYTENLRGTCKEDVMYHPKITFENKNYQKAYDAFIQDTAHLNDLPTVICGVNGPLLKYSSYRPEGTKYIAEGFENAMKHYNKKVNHIKDFLDY